MQIDVQQLAQEMSGAAAPLLKTGAPNIGPTEKLEFLKLAHTIAHTHGRLAAKEITLEEATAFLDLQKSAAQSALTASPGLSLIVVNQAIRAAYAAARPVVDAAAPGIVGPWPPT